MESCRPVTTLFSEAFSKSSFKIFFPSAISYHHDDNILHSLRKRQVIWRESEVSFPEPPRPCFLDHQSHSRSPIAILDHQSLFSITILHLVHSWSLISVFSIREIVFSISDRVSRPQRSASRPVILCFNPINLSSRSPIFNLYHFWMVWRAIVCFTGKIKRSHS